MVTVGPAGAEKGELLADVIEVGCGDRGERGVEGLGIEAPGDGDVVEVPGNEEVIDGHSMREFLGDDFGVGLKCHACATHGVAGDGAGSEGPGGEHGDLAVRHGDQRMAGADAELLYGTGMACDAAAQQFGVVIQPGVGFGIDEEIQVGAVAVPPAGGKGGADAEPQVVFSAEVVGERLANGFEDFGRAAGEVQFRHRAKMRPALPKAIPPARRWWSRVVGGLVMTRQWSSRPRR